MTAVTIAGVRACKCPSHALVVMRETDGGRRFRLRVQSDAGQAILAELAGIVHSRTSLIDMMRDSIEAAGCEIAALVIAPDAYRLNARLMLRADDGERPVEVEPCEALIAACRLKIPVFVEERTPTVIPEAYQKALVDLDLSGLDS